jgi:Protein of unknown function (DUF3047)
MKSNDILFKLAVIVFLTFACHLATAEPLTIPVGEFLREKLDGWEEKSFEGNTRYTLVEQGGRRVLKAESRAAASGLFREIRVDLDKTPFLNWSWRIENSLGGLDEQTKQGDDYSARVYVVVSGGLAFWRTRAVNYVWASRSPKGFEWPNAFAGDNAMMVALRSGEANVRKWVREKRDVRADLRRFFGSDIRYIDAVALMTDTDNSQQQATAYYGDIFFSEK